MVKDSSKKTENKDSGISDIIKKVVSVGVGAAFMTEDAIKNALQDLPLPKDIVTGLVHNAKNAKEDFSNTIMEEVRNQFSKIDPNRIVEDILEKYDIEVNATFKFKKKSKGKAKAKAKKD